MNFYLNSIEIELNSIGYQFLFSFNRYPGKQISEEFFSSRFFIEIQFNQIQFLLEFQEARRYLIEIQDIPIQFILELQESQRSFNIFLLNLY